MRGSISRAWHSFAAGRKPEEAHITDEDRNVRAIEAWLKPRLVAQVGQSRAPSAQFAGPPSTSIASTFSG